MSEVVKNPENHGIMQTTELFGNKGMLDGVSKVNNLSKDNQEADVNLEGNGEQTADVDMEDEDDFENEIDEAAGVSDTDEGKVNETNEEDNDGKPEGLIGYKYKKVLKYHCPKSSLEPLPEGWLMISHSSGMPIYFHKQTRVVTWSRPYCLMSGYLQRHKVPLASIPCLHYQRNIEKMTKPNIDDTVINGTISETENGKNEHPHEKTEENTTSDTAPQPKVFLLAQKDLTLGDEEMDEYLQKRFEFQTLEIPRFQKWSQRRNFTRIQRRKQLKEASSTAALDGDEEKTKAVGSGAKLITLTVEQEDGGGNSRNKKFVLNTNGKPMICILHEYAQRVLRVQPKYIFNLREDSAEPFEATIKLNEKIYGKAVAINKKTAKNKAALSTLEMLIPGFKGQVESASEPPDLGYFDNVSLTDSRVYELCIHTGQLLPYQLLTECLKRNQGITDTAISYDVQQGKRKSLNYTMKCGKHVVNGVAKNKKIGKQMAAQQILSLLHPKIKTWAELIALYGTSLAQERAHRKQAEQEIFDLKQRRGNAEDDRPGTSAGKSQSSTEDQNSLEPNPELLAKLRDMMLKLQDRRGRKRKADEEEERSGKKKKLTPMAAAVAAGKGLLDIPCESDVTEEQVKAEPTPGVE